MYTSGGANEHDHDGEARSRRASSVRVRRADRMTELRAAHNARGRLAAGHVLGRADIVGLQRLAGNRAVSAVVSRGQRDAAPAADTGAGTDTAPPVRDVTARSGPPLDHTQTRHAAEPATVQRLVIMPGYGDQLLWKAARDRAFHMAHKRELPEGDPRAKWYYLRQGGKLTEAETDELHRLDDPKLLPPDETLVIVQHGYAASPRREPTLGGVLTAQGLYKYLEDAGWQKDHYGHVVLYACLAGRRRAGLASFVDRFSNIVYSHERRNPIKGYTGVVRPEWVEGDPSKKHKRWILKGAEANDTYWLRTRLSEIQKAKHSDLEVKVWAEFKFDLFDLVKRYEDQKLPVPGILKRAMGFASRKFSLQRFWAFSADVEAMIEVYDAELSKKARAKEVEPIHWSLTAGADGPNKQLTRYEDWQGHQAPENLDVLGDEKGVDVDSFAQGTKVVPDYATRVTWYVHVGAPHHLQIWEIGPGLVNDPLAAPSHASYLEFDQDARLRTGYAHGTLTPVAFADASTGVLAHSQFVYVVDDQNEGLGWVKLSELIGRAAGRPRIDALKGLKKNRFTIHRFRRSFSDIDESQTDKFEKFKAVLKCNWDIIKREENILIE